MRNRLNIDTGLIKLAGGGLGDAVAQGFDGISKVGDIKQKSEDRKQLFDLKKEVQAKELNDKKAKISGFRKVHPKTTAGLTDDEVYQLGDNINKIHTDETPMKFKESFTADNGDRIGIFYDGSVDENNKPIYQNVVLGKAKDYQGSKTQKPKDLGYGFNPDGTPKTALEFGQEQVSNRAKKKKERFDLENTEIK
jgi:hypothetical protein